MAGFDDLLSDSLDVLFGQHATEIAYTPFGQQEIPVDAIIGPPQDRVTDTNSGRVIAKTLQLTVRLSQVGNPARRDTAILFEKTWTCDGIDSRQSGLAVLQMKLLETTEITPGYRTRR